MTTDGKGDQTSDAVNTPCELLKRAARIRKAALLYFVDVPFGQRLENLADDLEARAARLAGR